jgi:hypothetical protein
MPRGFWSYILEGEIPVTPPPHSTMTHEEFLQFSPGMRREMWKTFIKTENDVDNSS